MLKTIASFDRMGEENAFAVLARATALAAQGRAAGFSDPASYRGSSGEGAA